MKRGRKSEKEEDSEGRMEREEDSEGRMEREEDSEGRAESGSGTVKGKCS